MKVIICGAGQVGWQIARQLSGERNSVTVVDKNPELVRRATDTLDVSGIVGHAAYPEILDAAGAEDADMIIAATHSDEVNMVSCQVAHSVFNVQRKIARIRSKSYLDTLYSDLYRRDHMPIDVVISPEKEVADAALNRLSVPAAFDTEFFIDNQVQLLGLLISPDCPIVNTPLRQLTDLFSTLRAVVVAIRRHGQIFVPSANDQLFVHDMIYVMAAIEDVDRTLEIFGKETRKQHRLVIIGGGNVGYAVAHALEQSPNRPRVKLIEQNREIAEQAADALERSIVLHGDGMSAEMLTEANIEHADAMLAVTDDDKTNVLASVRARHMGCGTTICLANDPTLTPLMEPLGIDAFINPRTVTVSSILKHIRHGRVRNVYSIGDSEAEVIEAQVLGTSQMAGKRLSDIGFPEGSIVGAIRKGDSIVRPEGRTRVDEGDVLCIFALASVVERVENLLQVSIDYF